MTTKHTPATPMPLIVHVSHYWKVRRNGRTQTWKTRPGEFRIPIKFGFGSCGEIMQHSQFGEDGDFRIT